MNVTEHDAGEPQRISDVRIEVAGEHVERQAAEQPGRR